MALHASWPWAGTLVLGYLAGSEAPTAVPFNAARGDHSPGLALLEPHTAPDQTIDRVVFQRKGRR